MEQERKSGRRFEGSVGKMPSKWCRNEIGAGVSKEMPFKSLRNGVGAKERERPSRKTRAGKRLLRPHNIVFTRDAGNTYSHAFYAGRKQWENRKSL